MEIEGFAFGGGSITDKDWIFMKEIIQKEGVKTVLEFGAGLSTILLGQVAEKIITYETLHGWIKKLSPLINSEISIIRHWNGKDFLLEENDPKKFDFAFVDGPPGGGSREFSTKAASELADVVIVHDAGRPDDMKWQEKYLKEKFEMISKGGHRCHLWKRKSIIPLNAEP